MTNEQNDVERVRTKLLAARDTELGLTEFYINELTDMVGFVFRSDVQIELPFSMVLDERTSPEELARIVGNWRRTIESDQ